VISENVFHDSVYDQDYESMTKEITRVLKNGGIFIVSGTGDGMAIADYATKSGLKPVRSSMDVNFQVLYQKALE